MAKSMQCVHCHAGLPDDSRYGPACGHPITGRATAARTARLPIGLTIVILGAVVTFVVGFCGIVSAIAIPNLLNAIDRGKRKRTMADMRAAVRRGQFWAMATASGFASSSMSRSPSIRRNIASWDRLRSSERTPCSMTNSPLVQRTIS